MVIGAMDMEPFDVFKSDVQDSLRAYSIFSSGRTRDERQVNTILNGAFDGFLTSGLTAWKKGIADPVELLSDALVVVEDASAVYRNEMYPCAKFGFSEAEMVGAVLSGQSLELFEGTRAASHDFKATIPEFSPEYFWVPLAKSCLVGGLFSRYSRSDWESLRCQEHRGFRRYKKLYDLYWDGVDAIHRQDRTHCAEALCNMVSKVRSYVAGMDEERYGDIWDYSKKVDLKIAAIITVADQKFEGISKEVGLGYDLIYQRGWTNKSDLRERAPRLYPPRAKAWWRFW